MVIGQLLGLPIAFGSGQLSGAGFGPNYTILMKLGYEFYAPRILDEMQKNPEKSFEDTQYWRAFQKHLKSYTDKVLLQTIDSLAEFPKQTLDALQEKFGEFLSDAYSPSVSREGVSTLTSASNLGSQLVTIRLDLGQGFRREGEGGQQQGSSLFEKDLMKLREAEQAKILKDAKHKITQPKLKLKFATPQPTKAIAPAISKKNAGQSQKLELKKQQLSMVANAKEISGLQWILTHNVRPTDGPKKAKINKKIKVLLGRIRVSQQTVINLTDRYIF